MTITISKNELQADLEKFLQLVEQEGSEIVVTEDNVPVFRITSVKPKKTPNELINSWRGKISFDGSLLDPEATDEWFDV